MSKGSIQIYTSAAEQAVPLAGVSLTVLDESGAALAHLTSDADGYAEAADLPAPAASYSLDKANTTVRPYAVYRIEAALDGWQPLVVDGVQVFDGQATAARLTLLPAWALLAEGDITETGRDADGRRTVTVTAAGVRIVFAFTEKAQRPALLRLEADGYGAEMRISWKE